MVDGAGLGRRIFAVDSRGEMGFEEACGLVAVKRVASATLEAKRAERAERDMLVEGSLRWWVEGWWQGVESSNGGALGNCVEFENALLTFEAG